MVLSASYMYTVLAYLALVQQFTTIYSVVIDMTFAHRWCLSLISECGEFNQPWFSFIHYEVSIFELAFTFNLINPFCSVLKKVKPIQPRLQLDSVSVV